MQIVAIVLGLVLLGLTFLIIKTKGLFLPIKKGKEMQATTISQLFIPVFILLAIGTIATCFLSTTLLLICVALAGLSVMMYSLILVSFM